jgi:predicted molibdopterin-dependent oxidoreductase YjgC
MTVQIVVDGERVSVAEGMMLTSALLASGKHVLRVHGITGEPRGAYCGMGVCFECEVRIDGRPAQRACLTRVYAGMRIDTDAASGR